MLAGLVFTLPVCKENVDPQVLHPQALQVSTIKKPETVNGLQKGIV